MGPKDIDYDVFASGPYCVYCTSSRDGRHWSQPKPIQPRRVIPLAVLGKLPEAWRLEVALGDVIQRLEQRLQQEASGDRAERLLTAAYILTGLRLPKPEDVSQLFRGVSIAMRESVTYQAILDEGRVDELRRTILRLGRKRFGEADEATRQQIEAIRDIDALEEMSDRLLEVSTWDELSA